MALAIALCAACAGTPTGEGATPARTPPPSSTSRQHEILAEIDRQRATDRVNAAAAPSAPPEEEVPLVEGYRQESPEIDRLLRGVAGGTVRLRGYVDPARGLAEVVDLESLESGRRAQTQELLCGARLRTWFAHHRAWLEGMLTMLDGSGEDWAYPLLHCTPEMCTYAGMMEGDAHVRLHFEVRRTGRPVLVAVASRSCCTVDDDWAAQADADAAGEIRRLRARGCGGREP